MRKEEIAALRGENMYRCGRLSPKLLTAFKAYLVCRNYSVQCLDTACV